MFTSVLCLQEGAGVGLQRRHHPPSVLQAEEWRAQPLPVLPQNRDVPTHVGPALPGDAQHTVSRHRGGFLSVLFQTTLPRDHKLFKWSSVSSSTSFARL